LFLFLESRWRAVGNNVINFGRLLKRTKREIHERTILLQFLGIILRVLRLEVPVYNGYITNQFQTTFAQGGKGGG
jgi:hypothetical protein